MGKNSKITKDSITIHPHVAELSSLHAHQIDKERWIGYRKEDGDNGAAARAVVQRDELARARKRGITEGSYLRFQELAAAMRAASTVTPGVLPDDPQASEDQS